MQAVKTITALDQQQAQLVSTPIPKEEWIYKWIEKKLEAVGFTKKWASRYKYRIIREWNTNPMHSIEKKRWLRRGFMPSTVGLYHLNEDNYAHYLSDVDYMRIHPLNNHFAFWINDKITLKYIFDHPICINKEKNEWVDLMPEYYLYIENDGHFSYLMDSPESIVKDEKYLIHLLREKKRLALKPSNGGGGFGFVDLQLVNDNIQWNEELISEEEFLQRQKSLNGYIITAFISQHHDFDKIWDKSACTLRVIGVKQLDDTFDGGNIDIISSYVRFGTESSGGACNMHTGGVAIHYDVESGEYGDFFFRYPGFGEEGQTRFECHPDTGWKPAKGEKIPLHEQVKDTVYAVCEHLSSLEYFGVDIVITNDGVQLLEINSLPAISSPQSLEGPIFENPKAAKFFKRKLAQKDAEIKKGKDA